MKPSAPFTLTTTPVNEPVFPQVALSGVEQRDNCDRTQVAPDVGRALKVTEDTEVVSQAYRLIHWK